jgi:hypothetical protein
MYIYGSIAGNGSIWLRKAGVGVHKNSTDNGGALNVEFVFFMSVVFTLCRIFQRVNSLI